MGTYLTFHLYGPFASFGDTAVGEYRPTYAHPSKSGILGLIAGSLGIKRENEDRLRSLSENLGFSVLVISSGSLLRDYHTAQVPSSVSVKRQPATTRKDELSIKDQNTILSTRDYRMDAYYCVALWSHGEAINLDEVRKALMHPVFTPYLGRKSCPPSLPFLPEIVESESAKDALLQAKKRMISIIESVITPVDDFYADSNFLLYQDFEPGMNVEGLQKNLRKDRLISRRNWQFGDRQEILMTVGG